MSQDAAGLEANEAQDIAAQLKSVFAGVGVNLPGEQLVIALINAWTKNRETYDPLALQVVDRVQAQLSQDFYYGFVRPLLAKAAQAPLPDILPMPQLKDDHGTPAPKSS